ncbi:MAG: hypothetical protein Alis3KO_04110 [Aliiglaciecola sp.]|uniref:hypothetical protein n=1 Tax=Aliiglaciecola sp. M165 TaxID=2593649 RepID=UPI00117C77DD|nr:hypothetical protein [Aliiglaciecola sp. M165]TRY29937.1 hypothetical protein FM019_17395 [Aliiglaciecola sp. M165]
MPYKVFEEDDHVYVKFHHAVDALDIVQITADEAFIKPFREKRKVVHDFSFAKSVDIDMREIREIAVLSNVESNFTESLTGIVIPFDEEALERIEALSAAIRNEKWIVHIAKDYEHAKTLL